MLYQPTVEHIPRFLPFQGERSFCPSLPERITSVHKQLLEQRLLFQQLVTEQLRKRKNKKKEALHSKNSIWDAVKLAQRFQKPEYHTRQAKIDLLRFDAVHHAKEMALVEPVTTFSYWHTVENNQTLGDGYFEDMGLMLNTFTQDLAQNGFNANRASIESITFERAKNILTKIATTGKKDALLITSFPDDIESGYHGVDSKHNWDKPETHHSFYYLLQVGAIHKDKGGSVTQFEIHTTQFRAWPNARQAIQFHEQLGSPLTQFDAPIPNLLFANTIQLTQENLESIASSMGLTGQSSIESLFREILNSSSEEHSINSTHIPKVNLSEFWQVQENYFNDFYLTVALPVFEEISQLENKKMDQKTQKYLQTKIDYLDKAFFYYSKIILGWIKIHNTNPNYLATFAEKSRIQKLMDFQQKLLLQLLGQKQTNDIPSIDDLKTVLDIDHRLATRQAVTGEEKKKLLSIWGFFSYVGNFASLLQCGAMTPFSIPLSIMNSTPTMGVSLAEFSGSLVSISLPERQKFLSLLQKETYIELDLTKQTPAAKRVYVVPKSYLDGAGCIVNDSGEVLGPCVDPVTKQRISLDDPRDTLAFPMTLAEFTQYINKLQQSIEQTSLTQIDSIFQTSDFSPIEKRKAQAVIKKMRQKLIKNSLGLQEFISGNITNDLESNNIWLQELILKLAFSINPVQTLIEEVELRLREKDPILEEIFEQNS
ncbi:MAG: hypothetical protein BroJett025_11050 [Patescibacteria group bacterium]|nr:MAG: hypothetical protein BroJett025_11050 [Patescibacteria group bacterium]